jgi:uncharacterized membrane protein YdfJ with MMPL/SSD domain
MLTWHGVRRRWHVFSTDWGRAAARHKWWTIGIWVLLVVLIVAWGKAVGGKTVDVYTIPSAESQKAEDLLTERLRATVLPAAVQATGASVFVGGQTAAFIDLGERIQDRLPLFIGAVIGLSFLLLMMVFRSVLVPLKAAIMNVLSIAAAYGVIVAIFQWGWLKGLVGLDELPIVSFVTDDHVRHPLRAVDGLRGLPAVADP